MIHPPRFSTYPSGSLTRLLLRSTVSVTCMFSFALPPFSFFASPSQCAIFLCSFCLGDALDRHPSMNVLVSNTCIQDAFNLAWKAAYVHLGLADKSVLDTYSTEHQPVGKAIIIRANQAFRDHSNVWEAQGTLTKTLSDRKAVLEKLSSDTKKGEVRRKAFRKAITSASHEFHALCLKWVSAILMMVSTPQMRRRNIVFPGAVLRTIFFTTNPILTPGVGFLTCG